MKWSMKSGRFETHLYTGADFTYISTDFRCDF